MGHHKEKNKNPCQLFSYEAAASPVAEVQVSRCYVSSVTTAVRGAMATPMCDMHKWGSHRFCGPRVRLEPIFTEYFASSINKNENKLVKKEENIIAFLADKFVLLK